MRTINHTHQRQSVSIQVIKSSISRSSQDQIRSKGISHVSILFIFVKFIFSQFRNSQLSQRVSIHQPVWMQVLLQVIGPNCQRFILSLLSRVFSCRLRAKLPLITKEAVVASNCHHCSQISSHCPPMLLSSSTSNVARIVSMRGFLLQLWWLIFVHWRILVCP